MNNKLTKLLKIKTNYTLKVDEKKHELLLIKSSLKEQLKQHHKNEDRSEYQKYY